VFKTLIGKAHPTSDGLRDDLSPAVNAAEGNDSDAAQGGETVMIWPFRNFSILLISGGIASLAAQGRIGYIRYRIV
jgi:hypothetical protein